MSESLQINFRFLLLLHHYNDESQFHCVTEHVNVFTKAPDLTLSIRVLHAPPLIPRLLTTCERDYHEPASNFFPSCLMRDRRRVAFPPYLINHAFGFLNSRWSSLICCMGCGVYWIAIRWKLRIIERTHRCLLVSFLNESLRFIGKS